MFRLFRNIFRKRLNSTRFAPNFVSLESREVPATFYVDPNALLQGDGKFTFNAGSPNQVTNLTLGTDIFTSFKAALTQSNSAAGADTLLLANGQISLDNSAGTLAVTDVTTITGQGAGITTLLPTKDTVDEFGANSALLLNSGTVLNIQNVAIDGGSNNGLKVGQLVRYQNGATGSISKSTFANAIFTPVDNNAGGINSGNLVVALGAGTVVNITGSNFDAPGAIGVAYDTGATGKIFDSSFTGRGSGNFLTYGVQVTNGSQNVLLAGNTYTNFRGQIGGVNSAGVFVTSVDLGTGDFGTLASVTVLGSQFTGNLSGVIVGQLDNASALDPNAKALIQHNNFSGNDNGVSTTDLAPSIIVNALMNWWGNATGPEAVGNVTAAGNNAGNTSNDVGTLVLWRDPAIAPNNAVLIAPTVVTSALTPTDYRSALTKSGVVITPVSTSPTGVSPVRFKIEFTEPVAGFELSDITITNPLGGTSKLLNSSNAPVTASTLDKTYFLEIAGASGNGPITVAVPAAGVGANGLPTIINQQFGGTAAGTPSSITFDTAAPTVTVTSPSGAIPIITTTSPAGFQLTFNEPVTGLTASDIVLTGAGAKGATVTLTPADATGTIYNVSISNISNRGDINLGLVAGAVNDLAGNASALLNPTKVATFNPVFSRGFAVGGDIGNSQPYFGVDETLATRTGTTPFGASFTGGVRVATADFNGDGTLDIVAGSGVGTRAEVRLYDGKTTQLIGTFNPFESSFDLGTFVSVGDVNGDGTPDIVVTPDIGGSTRTTVLDGKTFVGTNTAKVLANFFALADDTNFRGGGRTGVGDFNLDGKAEIVFAAGFGGGPRVAIFNGATIGTVVAGSAARLVNDFYAFPGADIERLRNGAYVAVGDINGDGVVDVVAGSGQDGAARISSFSGSDLLLNKQTTIANFYAGNVLNAIDYRGGVRVGVTDLDGDNKFEIIAGPGNGGGSKVGIFNGSNTGLVATGTGLLNPDRTVDVFSNFGNGVFVGGAYLPAVVGTAGTGT